MWKILVALLCTCALALAAKPCSITLPKDIKGFAPVILSKGSAGYELFRPTGRVTNIADGESLHFNCAGQKNTIVSLGVSSVDLKCSGGKFVDENGNDVALNTLLCKAIPLSVLKATSEKCSNDQGILREAGLEVNDEFYPIFEICYDSSTETTLYTHNTLQGDNINYNIAEKSRPTFNAQGTKFNTRTVNNLYTQKNQIKVFEKIFGEGQTYIDKKNFLSRGHLSPDADFMFGYEQFSTYFYANVAPQYQPVNAGNWLKVEDLARSLAGAYQTDIESYNGYLGSVEYPLKKKMIQVFLDENEEFPIPKYYFKVLWDKSADAAIVFLSVNDPFNKDGKANEFCTNICDKANMDQHNFKDSKKGYTFCCSLDDFKKTFNGLPKEVKAKNLLMYKENDKKGQKRPRDEE